MTKIITTAKFEVRGLSFKTIAKAMDKTNVCSYIKEEFDAFVVERGLAIGEFVPMANHSIGGRNWELEKGAEPVFFEEKTFNGGWYLLREEEVLSLYCSSATSGSTLIADKQRDGWRLELGVPVTDGVLYKGAYWEAFHRACGFAGAYVRED